MTDINTSPMEVLVGLELFMSHKKGTESLIICFEANMSSCVFFFACFFFFYTEGAVMILFYPVP